jgi:hypothetical protein
MLRVFFTVDTEAHPASKNWAERGLAAEIRRDIVGMTPEGEFGAFYQAKTLEQFGLKGVFFTEALFSYSAGLDALRTVVAGIQDRGHEVGLHLHPEWLKRAPQVSVLPGKEGNMMRLFSEDDQTTLIGKGVEQLQKAGVEKVYSFRAGGYAANFDTLRALARNGVLYDSSHNFCWMGNTCDMPTDEPLLQPRLLHGVYEFPVTFFADWPGHFRHAELCACSFGELQIALMRAWRENWHSFVIVSHSFELIKRLSRDGGPVGAADKTVIRRFRRLCEFLAANRDKFQTSTFRELDRSELPSRSYTKPLSGFLPHTAWRFAEQAVRRVY